MKVIERSVMTCLYFREGASLSGAQTRELRREVWIAARAGKDIFFKEACWAVLFTIGAKGNLVDPEQFVDYRTDLAFVRWSPDANASDDLLAVWNALSAGQRSPQAHHPHACRCVAATTGGGQSIIP